VIATSDIHVVVPDSVDDPGHPSGGNVYDRRLCDELRAVGWPVRQHPVPGAWPRPDEAARKALAGVLDRLPDGSAVVLDGLIGSATPDLIVAGADRLRQVVLVHMPLGAGTQCRDDPARSLADVRRDEMAALSAAAAVITTSGWTRGWLADTYALPTPVHLAPPGVDLAGPAAGTSTGGELLCVAAVTPNKGHDVLVDALARLTDLSWRCTLVGALDLAPGYANRIRHQVASSGLADRVSFAGPRTGSLLRKSYAAADALVLASRAETYGMVVSEALAYGLPVIASRVGGVPEALGTVDGRPPGCLVEAGDPAALEAVLRRWLEDEHERAALRAVALARRPSLPGWSDTARHVARALRRVTDGHAA